MKCPLCNRKLQKRKEGLVCKNWKCQLYWKYGGWTYIKNRLEIKNEILDSEDHIIRGID